MLTSKLHRPSRLISFNINKGKTSIFGAYHSFTSHLGQVHPPDNPPRNLINLTGHDAPCRWTRSALEQVNSPTEEVTFLGGFRVAVEQIITFHPKGEHYMVPGRKKKCSIPISDDLPGLKLKSQTPNFRGFAGKAFG